MDGTPSHAAVTPATQPPGALPTGPPQHDNDDIQITGIKIMPTNSEIASGAPPYLPAADPASWHLSGASGRFDRLFRLLREESVGQVRDACREVLQAVRGSGLEVYKRQRISTHFDVCDDAKIHHISMHEKDGLQFIFALKQPEQVRHLTDRQKRDWWEHCNRFRRGTLVCVLDRDGHVLHFVVSDWATRLPAYSGGGIPRQNFSLSGDVDQAYVRLRLIDSSQLRDALHCIGTQRTHYFLEFPDVTLASFKYTLKALQYHYPSPHRLVSVLNHDSAVLQPSQEVSMPQYARTTGFTFNLDCLMPNGRSFHFRPSHAPTVSQARSLADLEPAQAMALLASLAREVALIGGLPGNGKSYLARKIIKVLLHNRDTANIGPILFVFRDDAALDHAVEQLLEDGIEGIVRMGGPSASKHLQNLNLPVTSYTGMGNQETLAEELTKDFLDMIVADIERQLARFSALDSPGSYPAIVRKLTRSNVQYEENRSELQLIHDNPRRLVLRDAHVVAVTTTELARHPELLQSIHAKVILCDDAGELQESHVLTALLPSTEHIILIGSQTVQSERQRMILEGVQSPTEISFFEQLHNSAHWNCPRLSLVRGPSSIGDSPLICGKSYPDCPHFCQFPRHGDVECGPCQQPCDVRCSHSRCERLCHEPCIPCTEEQCASGCQHSRCTEPCSAPCNWVPCSRRCTLVLDCGHQCPSLCGEACPDSRHCQSCGPEDHLMTPMMSSSGMKDYRDVNLDQDPCIFPRCGHFQTRSSMDEQLRMRDYYNLDGDGLPSSIKGRLRAFSMQEVPHCTRCRSSFREICRYGRIIRGPMIDESLEEFLTWRDGKFRELIHFLAQHVPASNLHKAYNGLGSSSIRHQHYPVELRGNMLNNMVVLNGLVGEGRYRGLITLFIDIREFSYSELKPREEVFQKVFGSRRRRNENNSSSTAHFTDASRLYEPPLKLYGDIFGMDLLLRCNIAVLDDFLRLWSRHPAASTRAVSRPTLDLDLVRNFRGTQQFIRKAQAAKSHMITAQGHVYFAWYCGFALAMGVSTSTRERQPGRAAGGEAGIPASQEEFRRSADQHLAEADKLYNASLHPSRRLKDAIEATRDFVRSSNQGSLRVNGTLWYKNITSVFERSGPWYVCDNGHPFMDVRKPSMFLGQLRCNDCGLIVAGRERASEEEASLDVAVAAPPQDELLIDI